MPAYVVAVCSYPDRAAAESVRDLIDRDAADNAIDGAPSRIVATSVHDTPPVVLAGLVRGGEIRTAGEAAMLAPECLFVDASGRYLFHAFEVDTRPKPITWYRYPEEG